MFLKKRKEYKLRLLKKKHFIDLWGQYKKKRKFCQNHFQRSLLWFSRFVDRKLYPPIKAVKNNSYPPRSFLSKERVYRRDKFGRLDKRSLEYRRPATFRKISQYRAFLRRYRRLPRSRKLLSFLKLYGRWHAKTHRRIKQVLLSRIFFMRPSFKPLRRWRIAAARKIARLNTRRYRIKPDIYRRIYLRAGRSKRVEIFRQQYYYGFNKLSTFAAFFRKIEAAHGSFKFKVGLEGLLAHLLYRCNLVHTVRAAHVLIRAGAVYLNDYSAVTNIHKCLKVGDKFGVFPRYIKIIYRVLKKSLRRRLVRINVPNYLDYNYRLMVFFLWRAPTVSERSFLHHAPYSKAVPLKITVSKRGLINAYS